MLSDDKRQLVIDEVQRHYDKEKQPYYLAELGQFFRSKNIEIPSGKQFKDFLAESFQSHLVVVQDPDVRARIAIALPDRSEQVQEQLAGRFSSTEGRPPIAVNRLPFSLIAAFCQKPTSGLRVFYRTIHPTRYVIASVAPDDFFVEIGETFRQHPPAGTSVHALPIEFRQDIYRRISEWAAIQNVNLEAIYVDEGRRTSIPRIDSRITISNALQRLIEAQEPEIRKRMYVPGDIALALMQIG